MTRCTFYSGSHPAKQSYAALEQTHAHTRPIPIDLHPASFALPRLTLHAGLANALPGAPGQFEHDYPSIPGVPMKRHDEEANDLAARPKIAWKRRDRRKNLRITVHK